MGTTPKFLGSFLRGTIHVIDLMKHHTLERFWTYSMKNILDRWEKLKISELRSWKQQSNCYENA